MESTLFSIISLSTLLAKAELDPCLTPGSGQRIQDGLGQLLEGMVILQDEFDRVSTEDAKALIEALDREHSHPRQRHKALHGLNNCSSGDTQKLSNKETLFREIVEMSASAASMGRSRDETGPEEIDLMAVVVNAVIQDVMELQEAGESLSDGGDPLTPTNDKSES